MTKELRKVLADALNAHAMGWRTLSKQHRRDAKEAKIPSQKEYRDGYANGLELAARELETMARVIREGGE